MWLLLLCVFATLVGAVYLMRKRIVHTYAILQSHARRSQETDGQTPLASAPSLTQSYGGAGPAGQGLPAEKSGSQWSLVG